MFGIYVQSKIPIEPGHCEIVVDSKPVVTFSYRDDAIEYAKWLNSLGLNKKFRTYLVDTYKVPPHNLMPGVKYWER